MPARRGRAGSEGVYDEGFAMDRALGYTCDPARSLPGADRALRDIEAAMGAILAMPFVDRDRVIIGGQSRGGTSGLPMRGSDLSSSKGSLTSSAAGGIGCPIGTVNPALFSRGARYLGRYDLALR